MFHKQIHQQVQQQQQKFPKTTQLFLPVETIFHVFCFIDDTWSLRNATYVCRLWFGVGQSEELWQFHYAKSWTLRNSPRVDPHVVLQRMKMAQEIYTVFETQCRFDHDNPNVWFTSWTMSWRQKCLHRYILYYFKNNKKVSEIIQEYVWGRIIIGGGKDDKRLAQRTIKNDDHKNSKWIQQFQRWSYDWLAENIIVLSPDDVLDKGSMEFVIFGAHDSFLRFTASHSNGTTIISCEPDWLCKVPPSHVLYRHKNALNVDFLFSETGEQLPNENDMNRDSAEITMLLLGILIQCDTPNRDMDIYSFIEMLRAVVSEII